MADSTTTSSESNNNCSIEEHKSNITSCPLEDTPLAIRDTNDLQTARTHVKGSDQSYIPVQTNLHRLIQNKLKRKKKLSASITSIHDAVNKKRRTRTEVQSQIKDNKENIPAQMEKVDNENIENKEERVVSKPPLPPKSDKLTKTTSGRLKRKLDDPSHNQVYRLNAQAEQLRLEVTELKAALNNEKNAVRALRAQNEADVRKSKAEIKKLQTILETTKKAAATISLRPQAKKSTKDDIKDTGVESGKLTQEILALKEANRVLEEKIQICKEAERRRRQTSDIRQMKDSYEIRLTQISKSAKTEISRLLEEIKTKERNIGQLKKEIHTLRNSANKRETRNAQHPPEMRKLKDIERTNNTHSSNQKCITTTCGEDGFKSVPHEITERILEVHNELHIFRAKDPTGSDTDSALSSAPQSISPQPPPTGADTPDIWQSVKTYSKELENIQKINETVQRENEILKKELESAKQQILDLEKTVLEANNSSSRMQQYVERIKYLEQREDNLKRQSHELREQNELLEFRIIELEESHDKWSLRSNSTPDTRDMWTDTEKEPDDLLMYTDRSDSGITSPHSHHHIDDRNVISPCDLSLLDHVSNDEIKRRIAAMTKRPNLDEEDKLCLFQVLTLINNLETLSSDSLIVSEEMMSLDMVKSKASDYSSASSSPRSLLTDVQPLQKSKNNSRIVATVLPYSSTLSTPTDSPRKFRSWNSSLQESGVFEGDPSDSLYSQSTQTEAEDFPSLEGPSTGDLCAEIQKLNKFREKIEECVTKQSTKAPVPVPTILSPNLSDQRRLQYYKDRLELLENKVLVYESSGDLQAKRLAERLQREVQLEALVKDLKQRVECLEAENLRLEEEKCEFEEAENDTRLRLQRLEVDLEIFSQRNVELDISRDAVQSKLKESRAQCTNLLDQIQQSKRKIKILEADREELNRKIGLIKLFLPTIVVFGIVMYCGSGNEGSEGSNETSDMYRQSGTNCKCDAKWNDRERDLTNSISELNRAYQETMENADVLWAQIEREYKDKLAESLKTEQCLKLKICKLEERLHNDACCAYERICQLEEIEGDLRGQVCCLTKKNKNLKDEHETLLIEHEHLKEDLDRIQKFCAGPGAENLEKEKKRVKELEDDLEALNKLLSEMEESHKKDLTDLRNKLVVSKKCLCNAEVTNGELKEEVATLEKQLCEMQKLREMDEEKIKNLMDEIGTKDEYLSCQERLKQMGIGCKNLAEEMCQETASGGLSAAASLLAKCIAEMEHCDQCQDQEEMLEIAEEIKNLTEVVRPPKADGKQVCKDDEKDDGNENEKGGDDGGGGGNDGGDGGDRLSGGFSLGIIDSDEDLDDDNPPERDRRDMDGYRNLNRAGPDHDNTKSTQQNDVQRLSAGYTKDDKSSEENMKQLYTPRDLQEDSARESDVYSVREAEDSIMNSGLLATKDNENTVKEMEDAFKIGEIYILTDSAIEVRTEGDNVDSPRESQIYTARDKPGSAGESETFIARYKINTPRESKTYTARDKIDSPKESKTYTARDQINSPRESKTFTARDQIGSPKGSKTYTARDKINSPRESKIYTAKDKLVSPRESKTYTARDQINSPRQSKTYTARDKIVSPRGSKTFEAKDKEVSSRTSDIISVKLQETKSDIEVFTARDQEETTIENKSNAKPDNEDTDKKSETFSAKEPDDSPRESETYSAQTGEMFIYRPSGLDEKVVFEGFTDYQIDPIDINDEITRISAGYSNDDVDGLKKYRDLKQINQFLKEKQDKIINSITSEILKIVQVNNTNVGPVQKEMVSEDSFQPDIFFDVDNPSHTEPSKNLAVSPVLYFEVSPDKPDDKNDTGIVSVESTQDSMKSVDDAVSKLLNVKTGHEIIQGVQQRKEGPSVPIADSISNLITGTSLGDDLSDEITPDNRERVILMKLNEAFRSKGDTFLLRNNFDDNSRESSTLSPISEISSIESQNIKKNFQDNLLFLSSNSTIMTNSDSSHGFSEELISVEYLQDKRDKPGRATKRSSDGSIKKSNAIKILLKLLCSELKKTPEVHEAKKKLKELYKSDKIFKNCVKLTLKLGTAPKSSENLTDMVKSYDDIVKSMRCLKTIEDVFKPIKVTAIKKFEEEIINKLFSYYKRSSDAKLRCAVYFPAERSSKDDPEKK